jgi:hypothetical protein
MADTLQETTRKRPTPAKNRTPKTSTDEMRSPTHDDIAQRARELHEKSGYAGGRDLEFWLEAERQLRQERNA